MNGLSLFVNISFWMSVIFYSNFSFKKYHQILSCLKRNRIQHTFIQTEMSTLTFNPKRALWVQDFNRHFVFIRIAPRSPSTPRLVQTISPCPQLGRFPCTSARATPDPPPTHKLWEGQQTQVTRRRLTLLAEALAEGGVTSGTRVTGESWRTSVQLLVLSIVP